MLGFRCPVLYASKWVVDCIGQHAAYSVVSQMLADPMFRQLNEVLVL